MTSEERGGGVSHIIKKNAYHSLASVSRHWCGDLVVVVRGEARLIDDLTVISDH
jgi:hypothetical protein